MRIFLVLKASYGASSIGNHGAKSSAGLSLMTEGIDNTPALNIPRQKETGHGDPSGTDDVNDRVPGVDNCVPPGATHLGLALY